MTLTRLEQLHRDATPGPWKWHVHTPEERLAGEVEVRQPYRMFLDATGRSYEHVLKITWPELLRDADAALIAEVRNALPGLLAIARAAAAAEEMITAFLHVGFRPAREEIYAVRDGLRVALAALADPPPGDTPAAIAATETNVLGGSGAA